MSLVHTFIDFRTLAPQGAYVSVYRLRTLSRDDIEHLVSLELIKRRHEGTESEEYALSRKLWVHFDLRTIKDSVTRHNYEARAQYMKARATGYNGKRRKAA